jgi:putative SOS response-associated peptidase YedK
MTPKPVWSHPIEEAAWHEKWCRVCFQPDESSKRITGDGPGCPHLARAAEGKLPTPWKKRRNAAYGDTYRCEAFLKQPAVNRRATVAEDVPMLSVDEGERYLVPVDGWPDFKAEMRKQKEGDHQ